MNPLAVYVHIPFCTVKCGYCDFNAYAGMDALKPSYCDAVLNEIEQRREGLALHAVTSIAFGGGTPGEQPAADLHAMIEAIRSATIILPTAEISIEVNPGTTVEHYLRDLREAGITRLSIGAQSFVPHELQFLDRIHSVEAIRATVEGARRVGIGSVNVDLIYGLPGQTLETWRNNVQAAIALGVDHVSAYALTIEDGTPLGRKVASGAIEPAPEETVAEMYEEATSLLAAAGFEQYEISNWSRPGHQSRHNRTYWEFGEYLGLGAGAHGFFEGDRYENIADPREYIAAAAAGRNVIAESYAPDRETSMIDFLSVRLRLIEGFPVSEFKRWFSADIDAVLGDPLGRALSAGLLDYTAGRLALSSSGRLLHGEIIAQCLAHLRAHPEVLSGVVMASRC